MRYQVAKGIDELYIFISGRRQFEKGYIFYKSSYMTFWKVKTMKTVKKKKIPCCCRVTTSGVSWIKSETGCSVTREQMNSTSDQRTAHISLLVIPLLQEFHDKIIYNRININYSYIKLKFSGSQLETWQKNMSYNFSASRFDSLY